MSRISAVERVQRILSILPWIVANQGCAVEEVCERFAIDRKSLLDDLDYVFYHVGVDPFTPDVLADVLIEDDRIHVTLGDYFSRPLRLSSAEALTLLTAAKASMRLDADYGRDADQPDAAPGTAQEGLLTSAAHKLALALGIDTEETLEIRLSDADPELTATIRSAIANLTKLEIRYYSFGRDQLGDRVIEPLAITNRRGYWYLRAWCLNASGMRDFRLDRIYSATDLGESFDPRPSTAGDPFTIADRSRTVEITGPPEIEWIPRSYPVDSMETAPDGTIRIVLPVTAHHWLERLALRLPVAATVTDADSGEDLLWVREDAARRIIDRYEVV